jgi:hypothetical protein
MASYSGPGGRGARGFATGNSKDGAPQTLTKYIWEYLGNQIPPEVYGLRVVLPSAGPSPDGGSTESGAVSSRAVSDGGTTGGIEGGTLSQLPTPDGDASRNGTSGCCGCHAGAPARAPIHLGAIGGLMGLGRRRRRRQRRLTGRP